MLRTYVAQQCQLLHVARKITLPQKYCGEVFRSLMHCVFGSPLHRMLGSPRHCVFGSPLHRVFGSTLHLVFGSPLHLVFGSSLHLVFRSFSTGISVSPCAPSACNSGSSFLSDSTLLMAAWKRCTGHHYQRICLITGWPCSLKKGKETCTVPMNLHGFGKFARPTSRWAPKAHHRMGKTQKGLCERSFGTNVLVFAINTTTFSRRPNLLKQMSTKMSL